MKMNVNDIKVKILPILKKYNVKKAGIFGSVARNEENENSDVDILVEIDSDISLLDFVGMKIEIEETLGRKVDLVEYSTIKPTLRKRILREEVHIL
ncbi:nucleotidyltransferase family protein [Mesoaciditoga lauensis]|uniref:nucleotidyltransferase family protein n=1 Tax=Mesoaciditoga lauensis TaxID=1495039 RepID=UPI00055BFEC5|nr:nucleotidyltransferase family protein [Mesoaciditoga lauensis]